MLCPIGFSDARPRRAAIANGCVAVDAASRYDVDQSGEIDFWEFLRLFRSQLLDLKVLSRGPWARTRGRSFTLTDSSPGSVTDGMPWRAPRSYAWIRGSVSQEASCHSLFAQLWLLHGCLGHCAWRLPVEAGGCPGEGQGIWSTSGIDDSIFHRCRRCRKGHSIPMQQGAPFCVDVDHLCSDICGASVATCRKCWITSRGHRRRRQQQTRCAAAGCVTVVLCAAALCSVRSEWSRWMASSPGAVPRQLGTITGNRFPGVAAK
jgi:hypothetical protein